MQAKGEKGRRGVIKGATTHETNHNMKNIGAQHITTNKTSTHTSKKKGTLNNSKVEALDFTAFIAP